MNNELCVLKCKVIPSHCINNKTYDVWAVIRRDSDEKRSGEVCSSYCTCVAGLQGSCNHIIGMLFRVEAAVAKGATRPSKTSMSCQWTVLSGNKIQLTATKAEQLYFAKTKYGKSATSEKLKQAKVKLNMYKPSMHKQHLNELNDSTAIRERLFAKIGKHISNSSVGEVMQGRKASVSSTQNETATPLPISSMVSILSKHNPSEILMHLKLDKDQCNKIESVTRNQSTNPIWYEQRKGRITATKFYRVCTRTDSCLADKSKSAANLVAEIMGYKPKVQTLAMKHGLAMEPHAKRKLVEVFRESNHKKVTFSETGLVVSSEYPHLGASPDLILNCSCHGKFVVEIKCPESIKMYAPSIHNLNYLECDDDTVRLKERHSYFFQIQGQMGITQIHQGFFFVYTHGYYMQHVEFDHELFIKFNYFWSKYVVTEILSKCSMIDDRSAVGGQKPFIEVLNKNKSVTNGSVCGICIKNVKENPKSPKEYGIACERCLLWFHIRCVNVTEEKFHDK